MPQSTMLLQRPTRPLPVEGAAKDSSSLPIAPWTPKRQCGPFYEQERIANRLLVAEMRLYILKHYGQQALTTLDLKQSSCQ